MSIKGQSWVGCKGCHIHCPQVKSQDCIDDYHKECRGCNGCECHELNELDILYLFDQ